MLRCRGQPVALRCLAGVLDPTIHWGWRRIGSSASAAAQKKVHGGHSAAGYRERRRRRAAAVNVNLPDGSTGSVDGNAIAAVSAPAIPGAPARAFDKAAGPKSAELRAWQLAMFELARRHSIPQNHSEDPNKISKRTADYIPEVLEAWRKVVDGACSRNLWFRGAAKFYASSLSGVWPKFANIFLEHLMRRCHDDCNSDGAWQEPGPSFDGRRPGGSFSTPSSKKSTSPTAAAAAAAAAGADGGGQLNWKRGLEILKEAHNAGVAVSPDLMVIVLSQAPVGNSRKISHLVSDKGSRAFGFLASPDMLATAAIAHWREGVVVGAARHLDTMFTRRAGSKKKRMTTSPGPLVHERLAAAATQGEDPAAAGNEGAPSPASGAPAPGQRQRQWPWLLVVVDIYGRAGRWAEAAEAFGTFVGKSFPRRDHPGGSSPGASGRFARLPMPDEIGGGREGGASSAREGEKLSALPPPPEAWASVHPSVLVHATTSYLKLGMAEEASEALSFLRASLEAAGASPSSSAAAAAPAGSNGTMRAGDGGGGKTPSPHLTPPAGSSDPAWIEGTVRGFARLGGWDLAPGVLSPEIVGWFSSEAGTGAAGGSGSGSGSEGRLAQTLESLEAFLESKLGAKRPAQQGQEDGARACLEALKACRAGGVLEGSEEALVYAEALRWLSSSPAAAAPDADADAAEAGGHKDPPAAPLPMIDGVPAAAAARQEGFGGNGSNDYPSLLRSRCENLPQEAVLQAIGRAWAPDDEFPGEGGVSDAAKERRRFAAFALYEAGIESKALPADGHWTSRSAGVLSLNYGEYHMQDGAPLAALNLVLNDMRRKYSYGESVGRHVHQPQADLVMIMRDSTRALDTVKEVLWLLSAVSSSRCGPSPLGGLELLGRRGETGQAAHPAAATRQQGQPETALEQEQSLLEAVQQRQLQQQRASKLGGVVLSLPRRALQGWLLREGRAKRESRDGVDGDGGLWTPSWVEDGIDVVPPALPGVGVKEKGGGSGSSVGDIRGSREASFDSTYGLPPFSRVLKHFP